jgi:hypothetical protein
MLYFTLNQSHGEIFRIFDCVDLKIIRVNFIFIFILSHFVTLWAKSCFSTKIKGAFQAMIFNSNFGFGFKMMFLRWAKIYSLNIDSFFSTSHGISKYL